MRRVRLVRAPKESIGDPCVGQVEGLAKIEAHIEGSDLEQQDKDAGQPYFSQPGLNPRQQGHLPGQYSELRMPMIMDKERLLRTGQADMQPAEPSYQGTAMSEGNPGQDSTFLQSLTASMPRGPDPRGQPMLPDRRLKHGSRIPLHPQHTYLEENSTGMGLERLASLRMDSGDLSEARLHPEMHPAHRMGPEAYGMRQPWEGPPREGMNPIRGSRPIAYDDEVSGSGMYGPQYLRQERMNGMRGNHLGVGMSEQYMAHPDNFAHPPRAVARGRNHINHYSATDYTSFDPQMEHGYRDGKRWQPGTPSKSGLQRSMSEGVRLGGPSGTPRHLHRPHSAQIIPESSTNSGKPGSKEPSSSGRAGPSESPDFAMIYAFLGSMFDPVCHMINHADVMQQMAAIDRETTILILENCVHNLDTPYFLESYLGQIRSVSRGASARPPLSLSRESSEYDVTTRHNHTRGPLP